MLFGITYETWVTVCKMYFTLKIGTKKAYLQCFPFSKLSEEDQKYIISVPFFEKYINSGAFVMFKAVMLRTENFIQKSDNSFRDASLVSPILYLILQSIGKEISLKYISERPNNIEVYYAGSYEHMRPLYKQDYDDFFKSINVDLEQYQYFIKTDISNFFSNINLDVLMRQIDIVCNCNTPQISQIHLRLYKELFAYCGDGKFPLIDNSVVSSYLASVIYLDPIDCKIYQYIEKNISVFTDFRIIRYVDDMYILVSSEKPIETLYTTYNEIRNEYSSILKEIGLTLNSIKCCIKPTYEINDELKKSLYDEYVNDKKCDIETLFKGQLLCFINDIRKELSVNHYITIEKYNNFIDKHFSSADIEFTGNEVFNYFIYENKSEFESNETVTAIVQLIEQDVSFIYIDPKRLTIMIMNTHNDSAIKIFLNQLFIRNRANKWNSYDTTIAIAYLIQSQFRHIDLLEIFKDKCPELYRYYDIFCRSSFCHLEQEKHAEKFLSIINGEKKSFFLYYMYLIEQHKNNNLAMFAYFKNFFDRITAHLAFITHYEPNAKRPNYKRYYKEGDTKKFYAQVKNVDVDNIIQEAHILRNANPLSHASADLIDRDSPSKDIRDSIDNLNSLIDEFCQLRGI